MQVKQTHTLQRHMRTGLLDAQRMTAPALIPEAAVLSAMRDPYSHAQMLLKKMLRTWELDQAALRLEREILTAMARESDTGQDPRRVTTVVIEGIEHCRMSVQGTPGGIASTAHLLLWVCSQETLLARKILELYNITAERIINLMPALSSNEDMHFGVGPFIKDEGDEDEMDDDDEGMPETTMPKKTAAAPAAKQIAKFAADLTLAACEGRLDPIVGREAELDRLIQILCRRKKNNPALIGEPGVGKTAVVEALALRIAAGEVPALLRGKQIYSLDMAALLAGTKYRGEFESRMRELLDEITRSKNIILFIDEIHTIVGAGSTQGSLDTANILKPVLARGELQCIGATTLDEYRKNIETDGALERRFQKIVVDPATAEQTLNILQRIAPSYERHHGVSYTHEALRACVELTERYVADRFFPDKAIDALDEAGSRAALKGETAVDAAHIASLVHSMTGIPVESVSLGERERLTALADCLSKSVIGQPEAVQKIVRSIRRSRAGLKDPNKPMGVFMLVGPTGMGKTHLTKELARLMFDRPDALIRVDMGEYGEKHNVSRMIGSPPGYVGYGEGGQLTEAVRRKPYSVVLFDEIEKAHPDVCNLLLRIFDEGFITDGGGRRVDFRNTIIVMTSNAGSRAAAEVKAPIGYMPSATIAQSMGEHYQRSLSGIFAPEFLNRIDDVILFNTLAPCDMERIVVLELGALCTRLRSLGIELTATPAARKRLAELGFDPVFGARALRRTILTHIEEPLAEMLLSAVPLTAGRTRKLRLDCNARGQLRIAARRVAVAA